MSAAAGLAPGQLRAVGLTIGALYAFQAFRGTLTGLQIDRFYPLQGLVNLIAWAPGVVAMIALTFNRVRAGQAWLAVAGFSYPIALALWPLVAVPGENARVDFWIHQIPALAAIALMMTMPLWVATGGLIFYCLLVEAVMRTVGIVTDWNDTLVRSRNSLLYGGCFFLVLLAMVRTMERTNLVLDSSAREQAQATMMQARSDEIGRLDRLTHDFVLSLLSAAAEGVSADKLQIQAETVRRQLESGFPDSEAESSAGEVAERIARRSEGRGLPVVVEGITGQEPIPRGVAVEVEAAVDEAVRNVVRHAGGNGRVEVSLGPQSLMVQVVDSGPGFSMERLDARLGIRQSILERMNSLAGGQATIDSAPGQGTIVAIGWTAR